MKVPLTLLQVLFIPIATSIRFTVKTNRTWSGPIRGQVHGSSNDDKIAGGAYVDSIRKFPYMVSIMIYKDHQCGGVLLSMDFVATACHCLADLPEKGRAIIIDYLKLPAFSFTVGTKNLKKFESSAQIHKAKSVHIHPECQLSGNSLIYDHAVAIMNKPFQATPYVKPVKMYTWDSKEFRGKFLNMFRQENPYCVVAGWGDTRKGPATSNPLASDRLKFVQMLVLREKDCSTIWSNILPQQFSGFNFWKYGEICTVSKNMNESDCVGDSGSPFVCDHHLVATVSYGTEDCATGAPSVYATIAELLGWIKEDFPGELENNSDEEKENLSHIVDDPSSPYEPRSEPGSELQSKPGSKSLSPPQPSKRTRSISGGAKSMQVSLLHSLVSILKIFLLSFTLGFTV